MRVIGLMSGTSLDGIDAALVEIDGAGANDVRWRLLHFLERPYAPDQRERIHDALGAGTAAALCRLNVELGEAFAQAALALCAAAAADPQSIDAIGSHGQTVWHDPPAGGRRGATLQLGCASTIAERTGIPVVHDFRSRDVAAGGHGAPLVPFADRLLYSAPGVRRVLVNIGGMANLTWLPARGEAAPLLAFDTGPGNALIDAAVELATESRETFDRDGGRARRGRVDEALLADLRAHPFFATAPPRSTGRELFGRAYVRELLEREAPVDDAAWAGLVATLTALTATTIADSILRWLQPRGVDEVVVTGGGARNPALLERLAEAVAPLPLVTGEERGIDSAAKEAIAFAALAWAHLRRVAGNVPEATGAVGPRVLGSLTPGSGDR